MLTSAHGDHWKHEPYQRSQDPGHLPRDQLAARHPAQQPGLPAGARQELQEQTQPTTAAQLVCSNRKGKGPTFLRRQFVRC